jgi:hypothetical protein
MDSQDFAYLQHVSHQLEEIDRLLLTLLLLSSSIQENRSAGEERLRVKLRLGLDEH